MRAKGEAGPPRQRAGGGEEHASGHSCSGPGEYGEGNHGQPHISGSRLKASLLTLFLGLLLVRGGEVTIQPFAAYGRGKGRETRPRVVLPCADVTEGAHTDPGDTAYRAPWLRGSVLLPAASLDSR